MLSVLDGTCCCAGAAPQPCPPLRPPLLAHFQPPCTLHRSSCCPCSASPATCRPVPYRPLVSPPPPAPAHGFVAAPARLGRRGPTRLRPTRLRGVEAGLAAARAPATPSHRRTHDHCWDWGAVEPGGRRRRRAAPPCADAGTKRRLSEQRSLTPDEEEHVQQVLDSLYTSLPRRQHAYVTEHYCGGANAIAFVESLTHGLATDGDVSVFFSGALESELSGGAGTVPDARDHVCRPGSACRAQHACASP